MIKTFPEFREKLPSHNNWFHIFQTNMVMHNLPASDVAYSVAGDRLPDPVNSSRNQKPKSKK